MDARCQKFATDASSRPTDPKLIATLRKFLYRNQTERLSAASQQALCDACVRHAAAAASASASADEVAAAVGLVEDALAMPFNVFTTGHKKQLLKHLGRLRGLEGGGGGGAAGGAGPSAGPSAADARACSVTDVTPEGVIMLMDNAGETAVVTEATEEDAAMIREAFARADEIDLRAVFSSPSAAATGGATRHNQGGGGGGSSAAYTARVVEVVGFWN